MTHPLLEAWGHYTSRGKTTPDPAHMDEACATRAEMFAVIYPNFVKHEKAKAKKQKDQKP